MYYYKQSKTVSGVIVVMCNNLYVSYQNEHGREIRTTKIVEFLEHFNTAPTKNQLTEEIKELESGIKRQQESVDRHLESIAKQTTELSTYRTMLQSSCEE